MWPLLLVPGPILIGVFSSWPLALGTFWFGASFVVLILVVESLQTDMTRRFPKRPSVPSGRPSNDVFGGQGSLSDDE